MTATPDPAAPYWTYADLSLLFGLQEKRVREHMHEWRGRGFPQPLPWCTWQHRFRPSAVLLWKEREEDRAGAGVRQMRQRPRLVASG